MDENKRFQLIQELLNSGNAENVTIAVKLPDLRAFVTDTIYRTKQELQKEVENAKNDRLVRRSDTKEMLHVSYPTLWRWESRGLLVPVRLGKSVYYKYSEIKEIMDNGTEL